jgi:FMN-dependent NADH-azoreductase
MEIGLKHHVFVSNNIINELKQMNDLFRQLLGQNEYVYKNNDLEINFKITAITKEYIDVVHKG